MPERRRSQRLRPSFRRGAIVETSREAHLATVRDLAPQGAFLDTREGLARGTAVTLRLVLPGDGLPVAIEAHVLRGGGQGGIALGFDALPLRALRRLEKLCRRSRAAEMRRATPQARRWKVPVFVLMTRVAAPTLHDAQVRQAAGRSWMAKVKAACPRVKWVAHYALLGRYDFMDIFEAPDLETAQQVSLISRGEGALEAESWPAVPYDRFLEQLERAVG